MHSKIADQDIVRNITLQMYGYDGAPINGGSNSKIIFYNAWLQDFAEVALDYTTNDSIKYSTTFQYDRWQLE